MVDYYAPLYEWLVAENARLNNPVGWDASKNEFEPFDDIEIVGKCAEETFDSVKVDYTNELQKLMQKIRR